MNVHVQLIVQNPAATPTNHHCMPVVPIEGASYVACSFLRGYFFCLQCFNSEMFYSKPISDPNIYHPSYNQELEHH